MITKFINLLRVNGWWYTYRTVLNRLFKTPDPQLDPRWSEIQQKHFDKHPQYRPQTKSESEYLPPQSTPIDSYFAERFRSMDAIDSVIIPPGDKPRLNVVTDSLERDSLLGGVATALIVASKFANENNMDLRIITRNTPPNPQAFFNILKINGIAAPEKVDFYSDYTRDSKGEMTFKLELSENDIFFATSWWSAEAIKKTSLRKRFFYIIQEVETYFYPYGDDHYLCSQIMEDSNIDYIVNSHYLWDYFKTNNKNICNNGIYFEPAFSENLYSMGTMNEKQGKRKIFFYSRPNNPRNLFNYGLLIFNEAIKRNILDTNKWEICMLGQDIPHLAFCNGYEPKGMGRLGWHEYAEFLKDVDLTISLMYTPHPSYPPFDAACSGSVVLTNAHENKQSFDACKNVLVSNLDMDSFMKNMKKALLLAEDMETRKANCLASTINRDWNVSLESTMLFMKGCL